MLCKHVDCSKAEAGRKHDGVLSLILALVMAATTMVTSVNAHAQDLPSRFTPTIRIYNPTQWDGQTVVEVPIGRIATPGLIDWSKVKLACGGRELPFAIREGSPHWKARLAAPVETPRAEDILVFSVVVPPETWAHVAVVPGNRATGSAVSDGAEGLVVAYPDLRATIDKTTGALLQVEVAGKPILGAPFGVAFHRVAEGDPERKEQLPTASVDLVSSSSTPAMTELNFVLDSGSGLQMGLTYRVHAGGLIEILSDERPWKGHSPWLDHAVAYSLDIIGRKEPLPYLTERAPYYYECSKGYEEVVKAPAAVYHTSGGAVVELGEEFTNGRRWSRRLHFINAAESGRVATLVELADEGLVVLVDSLRSAWTAEKAEVICAPSDRAAADHIADALAAVGVTAEVKAAPAGREASQQGTVFLGLVDGPAAAGIDGDGFIIRPGKGEISLEIVARTPFGLMQAALRLARGLKVHGGSPTIPLIAQNPTAAIRAGGFGGGAHEVDFPHGSEVEWRHVLDGMISSGMNVMADLGMWSNWKMPVSFKYMPELRSDSPDARDELTGAMFSEIDRHREHGQRLLEYLSDRGVTVWEWLPIGCAPSTFYERFPEAESPRKGEPTWLGSGKIPCHTHPRYREYLTALLREKTETYSISGFVMIRDDNGGICDCPRCRASVKTSRTKNAVWDQYLVIYDILKDIGFRGDIAVYPYNDRYQPELDPLLPEDLLIVGHGSANALLVRNYDRVGPMGDTWLDNIYVPFRVPASCRMKRLLADRPSFWIGGAYRGAELPWESIGYFGWEATATVNSFRYEWGRRTFGDDNALAYVAAIDAYERLWEIHTLSMLAVHWVQMPAAERERISRDAREWVERFRKRLDKLEDAARTDSNAGWFAHVRLFGSFVAYHLRRLELFDRMRHAVHAHKNILGTSERLPEEIRRQLLDDYEAIYVAAEPFCKEAASVGGDMMKAAQKLLPPFREKGDGYHPWKLDPLLEIKQFSGAIRLSPGELRAGRAFELRLDIENTGVFPWVEGKGVQIKLKGEVEKLGLPSVWHYKGDPLVFGDRRTVTLDGTAPETPGELEITFELICPYRWVSASEDFRFIWK